MSVSRTATTLRGLTAAAAVVNIPWLQMGGAAKVSFGNLLNLVSYYIYTLR